MTAQAFFHSRAGKFALWPIFAAMFVVLATAGARAQNHVPAPDGLGVKLPALLSAQTLTHLLVPASDSQPLRLVGAKPWPGAAGRYVAIVCTGGAAPYKDTPEHPRCAQADGKDAPPLHVYLGIVIARKGVPPRLAAGSGLLDAQITWVISDLPAPQAAIHGGGRARPQIFARFDLAPYRIAPKEPAFGLRVAWRDTSAAGGGAYYTALYLFAAERGHLRQVLAAPMSAAIASIGGLNKNGTRIRRATAAENLVVMSRHQTAGHFDAIVKAKNWDPMARPWEEIIGVGLAVSFENGRIEVKAPVVGSSAAEAGVKPGDVITQIDAQSIAGLTQQAIEKKMRYIVGSKVTLTVERQAQAPFDVNLTRTLITLQPSAHILFRWSPAAGAYRAAECRLPCI